MSSERPAGATLEDGGSPGLHSRRERVVRDAPGDRTRGGRWSWIGPLGAAMAVGGWAVCFRSYGIFDLADEGTLLMQGLRVARGERPYVDFATGYGPLYFLLHGALVRLGGAAAVRLALVAGQGLAGAALFAATRRLAGSWAAALAVLVYTAYFLPVAPTQGAPFLVPYPAWWVGLLMLVGLLLVDPRAGAIAPARAAVAGAVAGVALGFKPNAGLLLAAAVAMAVVAGPPRHGRPGPVVAIVWGMFVVGVLGLAWAAIATALWWALVPPSVLFAVIGLRRSLPDSEVRSRLGAAAIGFAAVAVSGFLPVLVVLGPRRFLHEAFLVGAGVAEIYAVPFPAVGLLCAAGGLVLALGGRRAGTCLALSGLLLAMVAGAARGAGWPSALRLAMEEALLAGVPLVAWGAVVAAQRAGPPAVAAAAVALGAVLQLYPRPDFLHLATVAAPILPITAGLVRAGLASLGAAAAPRAGAIVLAAVALARLAPGLLTAAAIGRGAVEAVTIGETRLVIAAHGAARLRDVAAAASVLMARSEPAARILSFPACAIASFAAGRLGAGPHDYFFPGRPGRTEVAALVEAWRRDPPPLAVTCEARGTDLAAAWSAYPELVAWIERAYARVTTAGAFTVWERRR